MPLWLPVPAFSKDMCKILQPEMAMAGIEALAVTIQA